jgi:tripartite ATP-independent transporter DctM subunit
MSPELMSIIMFACLLIVLFSGLPIAFSMGGLAVIFGYLFWGPQCFYMFASKTYGLMDNYILVAAPLFIFMAMMVERSGIADDLYHAIHVWFGPLRGGLAIATILVCTVFGATTGIIGASVVSMGLLALPAMLKRGYQPELATGTICAGGTLGILIPPSLMLVVYGAYVGISVGDLFAAAILPGLLLSGLYIIYVGVLCHIRPDIGPPLPVEERKLGLKQKLALGAKSIVPPLFLILAVLGTIFFGIATPTEAAGMGALGSIILVACYGKLSWSVLKETCYRTLRVTSMVVFLVIGASAFTSVFLGVGGGKSVENLLSGLQIGPIGILAIMMFVLFILGMFIDWLAILLIIIPVFIPVANKLGFDPLWFALLICVNLQMSFLTPPFGYALFYLKGCAPPNVTLGHIYRGIIPFVILQMVGLLLCIIFPEIILWLPNKLMK